MDRKPRRRHSKATSHASHDGSVAKEAFSSSEGSSTASVEVSCGGETLLVSVEQHLQKASVERSSTGPASLLVHSSGLMGRQWQRLLRRLPAHSLAANLSGYPGGPSAGVGSAIEKDLGLLEGLLSLMNQPVDLVGHSYGGALAMWLAMRRPEAVGRVAVHEPVLWGVLASEEPELLDQTLTDEVEPLLDGSLEPGEEWMSRFVSFWSGPLAWKLMSPPLRRGFLLAATKVSREVTELCSDQTPLSAYADLKVPVLVTFGRRTPIAQRRVCELLARGLPSCRLVELPGGHMAPLTDPADYEQAVLGFLSSP